MKHEGTWDFLKQVFHSTKILNFGALFTDGTPQFLNPAEPEPGDDLEDSFSNSKK